MILENFFFFSWNTWKHPSKEIIFDEIHQNILIISWYLEQNEADFDIIFHFAGNSIDKSIAEIFFHLNWTCSKEMHKPKSHIFPGFPVRIIHEELIIKFINAKQM